MIKIVFVLASLLSFSLQAHSAAVSCKPGVDKMELAEMMKNEEFSIGYFYRDITRNDSGETTLFTHFSANFYTRTACYIGGIGKVETTKMSRSEMMQMDSWSNGYQSIAMIADEIFLPCEDGDHAKYYPVGKITKFNDEIYPGKGELRFLKSTLPDSCND